MRFLINGQEGAVITHVKSADSVLNVQLLNDDGSPINVASPAVITIEYFNDKTRSDTPLTTKTAVPAAGAAAGFATLTIQDTDVTPDRGTYYLWAKLNSTGSSGAGALVTVAILPSQIQII